MKERPNSIFGNINDIQQIFVSSRVLTGVEDLRPDIAEYHRGVLDSFGIVGPAVNFFGEMSRDMYLDWIDHTIRKS